MAVASSAAARAQRYLIIAYGINLGLVMGMLPGRIAFGGNLVRDAAQTEPFCYSITILKIGAAALTATAPPKD